jgi:hypothetical protein
VFIGILLTALLPAVVQTPAPVKSLAIINATLHQFEDGPPIPSGHTFIAGEMVFFSMQIQGYRVAPDQKIRLTYRIDALDSEGAPLAETNAGKVESESTYEDRDWLPKIRYSVLMPPHALSGQFQISAWVKDEISGQERKAEATFQVQGHQVDTSGTLTLRNFRFLRAEEDREPLAVASYKPGDTLWARFDITGFKTGEKNHIRVVYGISIVGPSGKVLLSNPQAAAEEDTPFYPRRYLPEIMSLNVQPKTTAGEYTLVVSVRDEVGQQTFESRQTFRVE